MKNLTPEMIEKAKAAKSAEELLEVAKANGVEMTADEAATYFAQLNPQSGELDDDDLDGVSGGLVQLINPSSTPCYTFKDGTLCKHCGKRNGDYKDGRMICLDCEMDMVDRPVAESEIKKTSTGRL